MSDILGQTIGRYEIKDLIGEGAMAKVYRAYDPEINRSVAFKVLKSDFCVDEEYLSRFLREAKAAGALSHSNIVTVFDVGEIDSSPYIMMELLEGKDLGDVLKEKQKMSVQQTLIIGLQLAKALNYAHKAGVVHRDIKPDNIVVLPDGESIKVADFGIARMNEREEAQKTQVGSVLGTPRYMSPEQALGEGVDGRSDLFAVGVIMYEMLTGAKAFDAENIGTLMTQITQKQPRPLQELCPDIPAGLRQIIQKLLQKKPDKRFQTGEQLAAAIGKELAALRDQEEEQKKHKYMPLRVKWAMYMGAIVATVLLISMSVVFNIQSKSMTAQAVDSGASFAKFIAIETAVPLLSEDWITLETFISEAASRDTFSYLVVTDRNGIVRGASDTSLVGQRYEHEKEEELISDKDGIRTTSVVMKDGHHVFDINAPVLFQNTEVGQLTVGLSQASLQEVKSITHLLMFALAFVTISSVVVMIFIFGALLAKPLKTLSQSLNSFRGGNYDARISQTRNDEIGEVFDSFNNMAAKVQEVIHGDEAANPMVDDEEVIGDDQTAVNADTQDIKGEAEKTDPTPVPKTSDNGAPTESSTEDKTIIAGNKKEGALDNKKRPSKSAASKKTSTATRIRKTSSSAVNKNKKADTATTPDIQQEKHGQDDGAKHLETNMDATTIVASNAPSGLAMTTDSDATVISSSSNAVETAKSKQTTDNKTEPETPAEKTTS